MSQGAKDGGETQTKRQVGIPQRATDGGAVISNTSRATDGGAHISKDGWYVSRSQGRR